MSQFGGGASKNPPWVRQGQPMGMGVSQQNQIQPQMMTQLSNTAAMLQYPQAQMFQQSQLGQLQQPGMTMQTMGAIGTSQITAAGGLPASMQPTANAIQQQQLYSQVGTVSYPTRTVIASPFGGNSTMQAGSIANNSGNNSGNSSSNKQRVFTGTVTKVQDNFGFVDEEVFFQTSCCVKGSNPQVGDRVLVEAMFNATMPFKWNATRIQVLPMDRTSEPIHSSGSRNRFSSSYNNVPPPSEDLLSGANDFGRRNRAGTGINKRNRRDDDDFDRKRRRDDQRNNERNSIPGSAQGDFNSLPSHGTSMEIPKMNESLTEAEQPQTSTVLSQPKMASLETQMAVVASEDLAGTSSTNSGEEQFLDDNKNKTGELQEKVEGQEPAKRLKLSGAQRKKLKWLINHGHSKEEAEVLCKNPLPPRDNRPKSGNITPEEVSRKRNRGERERKESDKSWSLKASYKPITEEVRVGILHTNFPETQLSDEQMEQVQESILNLLAKGKYGGVVPRFNNIYRRQGYLVFSCKDGSTATWLKSKQEMLGLWEGASLKVVSEGEIPKTRVVTAFFPNSVQDPTKKILKLLEVQNGIPATRWKALKRTDEVTSVMLVLAVDSATADKLEQEGPWMYYKFGRIQLRLKQSCSRRKR